ncbi:MAG: hypothetical protein ACTSSI_08515 [Candidatus Helarchaeota archaeon]
MTCLNYVALIVLFSGCSYMHLTQKLNWFVYFCYIFSALMFAIYAVYLLDVYVLIQNTLFLVFDGIGVIKMLKVKRNGNNTDGEN